VTVGALPSVSIAASPAAIAAGASTTLMVSASNATQVIVNGSDGTSYLLGPSGGDSNPSAGLHHSYMATASGAFGKASAATGSYQ